MYIIHVNDGYYIKQCFFNKNLYHFLVITTFNFIKLSKAYSGNLFNSKPYSLSEPEGFIHTVKLSFFNVLCTTW